MGPPPPDRGGHGAVVRDRGTAKRKQADRYFCRAEALHLKIGAGPLLARTRQQAGGPLVTA